MKPVTTSYSINKKLSITHYLTAFCVFFTLFCPDKAQNIISAIGILSFGILHGAKAYCIQDNDGQIGETESLSSGLDYPSVSPLHCFLKDTGRAEYTSATDEQALEAYKLVSKLENISPSLEPSHAFATAISLAPKLSKDTILCIDSCGHSLKDSDIIKEKLGFYTE